MKKFKDLSKKQKMLAIPMFAIMLIGSVLATGYVVNSFILNVDVAEPFEISYAIVGDAGNPNWQNAVDCNDIDDEDYVDLSLETQPVDFSYIYAGESRKFCVLVDNKAENAINFNVASDVIAGSGNHADCVYAFGEITLDETAQPGTSKYGVIVNVPADAKPTNNCQVEVSVARG